MLRSSLIITLMVIVSAVSAQTCNSNITALTPTSQFTFNGDGTVTDTKSGLMWKRCLEGLSGNDCTTGGIGRRYTWQGALQVPEVLNAGAGFAGYKDWRLPNIKELHSIIELKCYEPAINLDVFPVPNTGSIDLWSSSPHIQDASSWDVSLDTGESTKTFRDMGGIAINEVLLVRGGL